MLEIPLHDGLSLSLMALDHGGDGGDDRNEGSRGRPRVPRGHATAPSPDATPGIPYPTALLQQGFILLDGSEQLAEEAVGFGVPVVKRGLDTVFPGGVELAWQTQEAVWTVAAAFGMDLVERLSSSRRTVRSRSLYLAKNSLAGLHRRAPALRGPLTSTSNALRRRFGWLTTFERVPRVATVVMTFVIDAGAGRVGVAAQLADAPLAGLTEVVVMNEQGARHFDCYEDSDGVRLEGDEIGTWDEVHAACAWFTSGARQVTFSVGGMTGGRLYRGRELIGDRVAWSGFGCSFTPGREAFGFELTIERR
jgi:hypothetical protein